MKTLIENITNLYKNRIELLKAKDKPKIGWVSIYTPEEILYAAGTIPFRITGELGIDITDAGALLNHNYCSYVLSCLSEGIAGIYDFAEGILFVDACDMRKRLCEVWTTYLKPGFSFFLDLPRDTKQISKDYFRLQLGELITLLEHHFKCTITDDVLREAIDVYNETRRLLQQFYTLRKSGLAGITGNEILSIVKAGAAGLKEEFNKNLALLIRHLKTYNRASTNVEEAATEKEKNNDSKKHRVLISGSYFDNSAIIESIEKFGASVICEDISNGIKYFESRVNPDEEPLKAITDYYLEKTTCARVVDSTRRLNHLLQLVEEYKADSVIYFSLKFCDTNLLDFPYIRDQLLEKGIPVLFIEGERHMTNIENIKTRILTFLEARMY
ncbi:MAG: 2-hydroxyacyl-CoA dehydratase [Spirochaetales bacterium]|nr:2-hydroxyacyl-CoA dehydratase [Spirochaetales bacterium]